MIVLQQIVLVLNLLVTVVFGVAYFVVESPKVMPKTKARMGVLLASMFLAFLVLLALFAVLSAILRQNVLFLALILFVLAPFVIGRLVSYRTLRFYTIVQILTLLLSAATLCIIMISQRGFFSEERTKPLLDEANAIVRILGKGVSTTCRRISGRIEVANPLDNDEQRWTMMHNSPDAT